MELSDVDPRYSLIEVSFAIAAFGSTFDMIFTPAETDPATFIADIVELHTQNRNVLISRGGATATILLERDQERDPFVSKRLDIIDINGFDGIDIELEGAHVSI